MKYHIWTEGCQMNVADSRRLTTSLEKLGYQQTRVLAEADLIILNTCVVRQSAENKAIGRLSSLRPLKLNNPGLTINLMGCLIGVHGNEAIQKRFPWVDVFSPPSDPAPLLEFLKARMEKSDKDSWRARIDDILDEEFVLPAENQAMSISENMPIVLGCSHACAYCVIPYKRGREISRPLDQIIQETNAFVAHGAREIVLLGQIVDRYGLDIPGSPHLDELLGELSKITDLKRLRFLTSHPNWMTDKLIDAVASLPKVMPHIEVPIQAGDDGILLAMRRGYTSDDYRLLIQKLRDRIPNVSIGTDIIVGFPGESDKAFNNTKQLLADLKMDVAHLARYSPRPHTYSSRFLEDDVPDQEKMRRFRELEDLQEQISTEINARSLGQITSVLFEGKSKERWRGRNPNNKLVFVETPQDLLGQEQNVRITWTGPWSMLGELS
jgi:tRNA-2-methylthio-N6-dimethylallyladenosine synthase